MATDTYTLTAEEEEFLAKCEEELKDRYTEKDDDFMAVFNAEPSKPPVVDSWWVSNNFNRRNDRRNNRRFHPYEKNERNDRERDNYERRDRGYSDYSSSNDRRQRYRY